MTLSIKLILVGTLVLFFLNCTKSTDGCFSYSQTGDRTITFDASCSKNTYFYHWTIDTLDKVTTTPTLTYTFPMPGNYDVLLIAGNKKGRTKGSLSSKVKKTITVN